MPKNEANSRPVITLLVERGMISCQVEVPNGENMEVRNLPFNQITELAHDVVNILKRAGAKGYSLINGANDENKLPMPELITFMGILGPPSPPQVAAA